MLNKSLRYGFLLAIIIAGQCVCAQNKKSAADYENDVASIFATSNCASLDCHGAIVGAGGLKMVLFSGDNLADYQTMFRTSRARVLDLQNMTESLLLKKLSGDIKHGGTTFKKDSEEYKTLFNWLENGAAFEVAGKLKPAALEVDNNLVVLEIGKSFKPKFTLKYTDLSVKDVSEAVFLRPSRQGVVEILQDGSIKAAGSGYVIVSASYIRNFAPIAVYVPRAKVPPEVAQKFSTKIDELVAVKQKLMNIAPSEICSDAEFLKRVYLDTTGFLPSAEIAEAFLRSNAKDKRAKLIDTLLLSEEFVDYLTLKLGDLLRIKSEFPSNLWPNAVQAYSAWIRNCILQNMPYDKMVRELLTTTGTNFKEPQVNFFRAVSERSASNYADAASLAFMGLRLNCVKCHAHPYEEWNIETARGVFAFFSKIYFKTTKEWKEEILCVNYNLNFKDPNNKVVAPKFITGETPAIPQNEDPRVIFVDWLLKPENPYFAKSAVNRVWYWLMNKGIIDPADDIRPNNLPSNPELLKHLEEEFAKNSYNLRGLFRLILNSDTYQRSCKKNEFNDGDDTFFSHKTPTRIYAESVNDIIQTVTGRADAFKSIIPEPYAFWPEGFRAVQITDASLSNTLLSLFGKPPRNSSYLNDRECTLTMPQVLYMASSSDISDKIQKSDFITDLGKMKIDNKDKIKKLYLSFLARFPSDKEYKVTEEYLRNNGNSENALKDLAWAIVNTKEFLFKF